MTVVTIKNTTFGNLKIGAMFQTPNRPDYFWFKKSTKTAVGTKPHQGPLGRNWDYFKSGDPVKGEVLTS